MAKKTVSPYGRVYFILGTIRSFSSRAKDLLYNYNVIRARRQQTRWNNDGKPTYTLAPLIRAYFWAGDRNSIIIMPLAAPILYYTVCTYNIISSCTSYTLYIFSHVLFCCPARALARCSLKTSLGCTNARHTRTLPHTSKCTAATQTTAHMFTRTQSGDHDTSLDDAFELIYEYIHIHNNMCVLYIWLMSACLMHTALTQFIRPSVRLFGSAGWSPARPLSIKQNHQLLL